MITKKQLNTINKNYSGMTNSEMIEDIIPDISDPDIQSILENCFDTVHSEFLYDRRDKESLLVVDEIMRSLHYDNGEPLTCDDYDYFEHYDRDQDYWGMFYDEVIDHFEIDKNGNLISVLLLDSDTLQQWLTEQYDNSDWKHDFGDTTPDEVHDSDYDEDNEY